RDIPYQGCENFCLFCVFCVFSRHFLTLSTWEFSREEAQNTQKENPSRHNARRDSSHALAATPVIFLETPLNGLLARCGTSLIDLRICPRRWRLGLFFWALDLGHWPRLLWAGPL